MNDLDTLCQSLGYTFNDESLADLALTHRSLGKKNNERLEFLGDSILGMVISTELYKRFPAEKEGVLTRLRASLVKGETLTEVANELKLGDFIRLGSGELKSGGFRRSSTLADVVEALIGAIYLDSGYPAAREFILKTFASRLDKCEPASILKDPKTRLQEYLQGQSLELPEYTVVSVTGKEHQQTFNVSCRVSLLTEVIEATGKSRRKAEQAAATKVMKQLKI